MDTAFTSQSFERTISAAKKSALQETATITDHGRRSNVLLTAEDYDKLVDSDNGLGDILWNGQDSAIELEIERRKCRPEQSSLAMKSTHLQTLPGHTSRQWPTASPESCKRFAQCRIHS